MKLRTLPVLLASILAALQSVAAAENERFVYPQPAKSDQVDDYFGTKVSDPYRVSPCVPLIVIFFGLGVGTTTR